MLVSAGMLGCGFSSSFKHLLFWRWVTGLGSALQMAGAQLFLADISRANNRARTLGTNQVIFDVSGLLHGCISKSQLDIKLPCLGLPCNVKF